MTSTCGIAGFAESLPEDIAAFLAFKRARGYKYHRAQFTLANLERFVAEEVVVRPGGGTEEAIQSWLARSGDRKPASVAAELTVIRQFCLFRRRRDPDGFAPHCKGMPRCPGSHFVPHVYTGEEVRTLVAMAQTVRCGKVRPSVVRMLLVILYCTGLRFGEALRLRLCDVDLPASRFFIAESKGRSRFVPFGEDLARELDQFASEREEWASAAPGSPFLAREDGSAWPVNRASDTVRDLLRRAGMKPRHGRSGPRPYDFRHTYAVRRLEEWYRDGVDISAALPLLSAYMGHYDLMGTERYLHTTPILLAIAGDRFRTLFETSGSKS
ncbi:MAG: integrase [Armatimonadetes bacterium]|nr:integrase [Armatimonadota bacterium]